jgi:tRNA (guanosine-2'-O-)-methyltransferase
LREEKLQLIEYLSSFVTDDRKQRIQTVLENRTRFLTLVLEDIYQPHNASAVLRSCECFGAQDVHIIEQNNQYKINPDVSLGAAKWLSLHRYHKPNVNNTIQCLENLKSQGYQIAAATLHEKSILLQSFDLKQKTAICFGAEELGLTKTAHELADVFVKIPMHGFTKSFNISVSAALFLFNLTEKLRQSNLAWQLTEEEKLDLTIEWLTKSIPHGEKIVELSSRGLTAGSSACHSEKQRDEESLSTP